MTSAAGSDHQSEIALLLQEARELRESVALSANRLATAAATLDRVLDELQDDREPGWRVAGWYAGCVALMVVALVAILHGAQGFASIAVTPTSVSAVQLAVQAPPGAPSADPFGTAKFYIAADYAQESSDGTSYTLWIPKTLAGRSFAFLLLGSAVMTDVKSTTTTVKAVDHTCTLDGESTLTPRSTTPVSEPCQVITGTVPTTMPPMPPLDCSLALADRVDYIPVLVSGSTRLTTRPDWAHQVTQVPSLSGDRFGAVTLSRWNGVPLGQTLGTADQVACKRLNKRNTWQPAGVVPEASDISSYQITWNRDRAAAADVVVTRDRDAQSAANLWIAGAGAAIALGVGFLPVAYESGREWLRGRRRRRAVLDAEGGRPPGSRHARSGRSASG